MAELCYAAQEGGEPGGPHPLRDPFNFFVDMMSVKCKPVCLVQSVTKLLNTKYNMYMRPV